MNDHQLSRLTTGMVKPPINPNTGSYSTLHDEDRPQHRSTMQERYNEDSLAVYQPEPKGFRPVSEVERDPGFTPFQVERDELTEQFYNKLQSLKSEHQKTLKMIELLHAEAETRCYQAKKYPERALDAETEIKRSENGYHRKIDKRENIFLTEDDSENSDGEEKKDEEREESDDESSDEYVEMEPQSERRQIVQFRESPEVSGEEDHLRHNRRIEQMWDDFNLKDYLTPSSIERIEEIKAKRERPKSAPVKKKEWSPVITIPKPFSMTLREERKKEKTHSKSSEEIAKAARERLEQEELEIRMRVRPRDPPAHTYLPLYEEIMERQEQRARMNRENAGRALQAMVKPFSFMERERAKQEENHKAKRVEKRKERKQIKSMAQFVAKPVPPCVHDPTVMDRMKEEELYRKIKIKLRSEDLMRSSALPPRMQSHEIMYAERRKKRNRDLKRANKLSFRPETRDMPNFDALHHRDDLERASRKMEIDTTMTEPFQFRTDALRKKKVAKLEAQQKVHEEDENFKNSMKLLGSSKKYTATSDTIPTRMTESARLRLEETKKAIAKAEYELLELKLKDRARKERRRQMAQEVTARTMAAEKDVTTSSEYRREKLKQYQMQQKARDHEYQKELQDMNNRLKERPLLFEQQAQKSARDKAEKRYKEILRNSGLSDDMFDEVSRQSRTNVTSTHSLGDYSSDDDFDASLNKSAPTIPKSVEREAEDTDSDVQEDIQSMKSDEEKENSRNSVKKQLDFDV